MAGREFLESIEVNYKKAVECLQKTEGKEIYSDELAGQIMTATALLKKIPNPSDEDIDNEMSGNICRCGTYLRIKKAIKSAALAKK